MKTILGVIGGSGVYDMPGLEEDRWEAVRSPWGDPSDAIRRGRLCGVEAAFLPRHGRGHVIPPSQINYRANIDALKRLGVTDLVSLSACGSLREDLPPGHFVIVDQYIDRTRGRAASFFGAGLVAHVSMADPVSLRLMTLAAEAAAALGIEHKMGGTYLIMEGPQFSTRAESHLYRQWGCDIIGMTAMPEAKLAREAEIPYTAIAMVTDYDCWRAGGDDVEVANVMEVLGANADKAQSLVAEFARRLTSERAAESADTVLDFAVITPPESRDAALVKKLDAILARMLAAEDK